MRAFIHDYSFPQDTFKSPPRNPAYISVKNVTSAALPALSIVTISTPIYTRSGDTFKNKGVEYGVEMNGAAPDSDSNNIAVTQEAIRPGCIGRAICSGATPCIIHKAANTAYKYAKPVTSQTGYMEGTDDVTNYRVLWIASGTGNKEAYICIDASGTPTPEYFVINAGNDGTQQAINNPSLYTAGSLHYITYSNGEWIPIAGNETTPSAPYTRPTARLAICQVDAPAGAKEFRMPYYTPEMNIGVPADFDSNNPYVTLGLYNRCGVVLGDHQFSGKNFDYCVTGTGTDSVKYEYQPVFIAYGLTANGTTGGGYIPYVEINNIQFDVDYPTTYTDGANYPDIYPYDVLTVQIDCVTSTALAIDYPKDYPAGTLMAFYQSPGRGWDAITTPQGMTDAGFTLYEKNKTGAIT